MVVGFKAADRDTPATATRTTPPFSAVTKPGRRSLGVIFYELFMVLP